MELGTAGMGSGARPWRPDLWSLPCLLPRVRLTRPPHTEPMVSAHSLHKDQLSASLGPRALLASGDTRMNQRAAFPARRELNSLGMILFS